ALTVREMTHLQFQEPSTQIHCCFTCWGSSPLAGMKRKTPANFTCSSPQPEQHSYVPQFNSQPMLHGMPSLLFGCICFIAAFNVITFVSPFCLIEVCEELKHLNKCESGPAWCDICSIPCTDGSAYRQHLDGKKACHLSKKPLIRQMKLELKIPSAPHLNNSC
ncbi:hypothetical protein MKW98_019677, partial [Papaver atlanticum]